MDNKILQSGLQEMYKSELSKEDSAIDTLLPPVQDIPVPKDTRRLIVIGDIHGALLPLQDLIEKINPKDKDTLFFVGDYVDGYPQSAEVVEFLISLSKEFDCIFIRGNHDEWQEQYLSTGVMNRDHKMNGGLTTKDSYDRFFKELPNASEVFDEHLKFFRNLHNYYIYDDMLFVHAGYNYRKDITKSLPDDFYWDRDFWYYAEYIEDIPYKRVFIGHTALSNESRFQPKDLIYEDNRIEPRTTGLITNVDTGAGWAGNLSALDITNNEIYTVMRSPFYYPGHKHR